MTLIKFCSCDSASWCCRICKPTFDNEKKLENQFQNMQNVGTYVLTLGQKSKEKHRSVQLPASLLVA